uniref:Uncharacterized protein n=1 Tax=Ciona intestinalis TaxID=7719 RepID=H2XWX1_CIOIN
MQTSTRNKYKISNNTITLFNEPYVHKKLTELHRILNMFLKHSIYTNNLKHEQTNR